MLRIKFCCVLFMILFCFSAKRTSGNEEQGSRFCYQPTTSALREQVRKFVDGRFLSILWKTDWVCNFTGLGDGTEFPRLPPCKKQRWYESGCSRASIVIANFDFTHVPANAFNYEFEIEDIILINNRRLATIDPEAFNGSQTMKKLVLRNTSLTKIPTDAIKDLRNLEHFHISQSPIAHFPRKDQYGTIINADWANGIPPSLKHLELESIGITELVGGWAMDLGGFSGTGRSQLHLKDNRIAQLYPGWSVGLEKLYALYLSGNMLTDLRQDVMDGFSNLAALYLDSNKISVVESGWAKGLNKLLDLSLARNSITELSKDWALGFSNEKLSWINLAENSLMSFNFIDPDWAKSLYHLNLSHNMISGPINPNWLPSNVTNLIYLNLDGNGITEFHRGWTQNLKKLKRLHLSRNNLTELNSFSFEHLELNRLNMEKNLISTLTGNWYMPLKSLKILILHDNHLSSLEGEWALHLKNLETLWVERNRIETLEDLRSDNLKNLFNLKLDGNRIKNLDGNWSRNLENLAYLSLQSNKISSLNGEFDDHLVNLVLLDLSSNTITELPTGWASGLGKTFVANLSNNEISKLGSGFASGLGTKTSFRLELDLSHNKISTIEKGWHEGLGNPKATIKGRGRRYVPQSGSGKGIGFPIVALSMTMLEAILTSTCGEVFWQAKRGKPIVI